MSGVFGTAHKNGWCQENPVARVEVPPIVEKPIIPLSLQECEQLQKTAQLPEYQDMQLSLHLMLYCGIRPTEVSRMNAEKDIDWERQQVLVRPTAAKTGGGRVVPLRRAGSITLRVIPKRWGARWRAIRLAAGWKDWKPDTLRHTFATYHAAHFRDLPELQLEMGHRDTTLLRTRYINAVSISRREARDFWQAPTP